MTFAGTRLITISVTRTRAITVVIAIVVSRMVGIDHRIRVGGGPAIRVAADLTTAGRVMGGLVMGGLVIRVVVLVIRVADRDRVRRGARISR